LVVAVRYVAQRPGWRNHRRCGSAALEIFNDAGAGKVLRLGDIGPGH
jgi:hypothetical protein